MTQAYEKGKALTHFKASVIVSALFLLFYTLLMTSIGYAKTAQVTIAHTNNLNGRLFAYKTSE